MKQLFENLMEKMRFANSIETMASGNRSARRRAKRLIKEQRKL